MKRDTNRIVITILVTFIVIGGSYFYLKKTEPKRTYKAETKQLELIKKHQSLQIEVMKLNAEIARLKAEAEKNTPTYKLTPKEE